MWRRTIPTPSTYTCSACGETYEKGWTDEEADAEYAEEFNGYTGPCEIVCDDCYQAVMKWVREHGH